MATTQAPRAAAERAGELEIGEDSIKGIGKELVKEITDDDVPGLAAEVAYHAIFSIPAVFVVLITLAAVIDNIADFDLAGRLQVEINESAPEPTRDILTVLVTNAVDQVDGGAASIGLASAMVLALWAGSNGVGALIKAFNRAYDATEERSFPRKKGAAILLTVMLGIIVNLAFALWVFGGKIGSWIASEFRMGSAFDWAWNISRFPAGVLVIIFMLGLLYYFGPTVDQAFRSVLPGAVLGTVLWGLLVLGFSIYLFFANPGSAYGALGGVIVFLFFLYLTALVFIVGAEFNAVLARRHDALYRRELRAREPEEIAFVPDGSAGRADRDGRSVSARGLAVGVAATVGIVLAAMLGRRNKL